MTWVGAPVPRTQDRRMLLGRGRFTGDIARTGTLHAAFVRSPFAAAAIGSHRHLRRAGPARRRRRVHRRGPG